MFGGIRLAAKLKEDGKLITKEPMRVKSERTKAAIAAPKKAKATKKKAPAKKKK